MDYVKVKINENYPMEYQITEIDSFFSGVFPALADLYLHSGSSNSATSVNNYHVI